MHEEVIEIIKKARKGMDETIEHLENELLKVRAGKASPSMLNGLLVDYYGSPTPLNQVANIILSDSRTISIQPWEKPMIGAIEKSIFEANLGITPQNNGEMVILNIPPLTEERRKDLVKKSKSLGEDAKISVRNNRQKAMDFIKKSVKDGYPEDQGKRQETSVQESVEQFNAKIIKMIEAKEKDIMTI